MAKKKAPVSTKPKKSPRMTSRRESPTAAQLGKQIMTVELKLVNAGKVLAQLEEDMKELLRHEERVKKKLEGNSRRLNAVLDRITVQLDSLKRRETTRFEKVKNSVAETMVEMKRFGHSWRLMRFDEVRRDDYPSADSRKKLENLRRTLSEASERYNTFNRFFGTSAKNVSIHPTCPASLASLILQREQIKADINSNPLKNLATSRQQVERKIVAQKRIYNDLVTQRGSLEMQILKSSQGSATAPKRVLMQWSDAEELARDYLIWMGFSGVRCTGEGTDGGVDVEGDELVAQVKMHNRSTGRPELQRLKGIAAAEDKIPVFFAMAFSVEAKVWAEKAHIALFQFRRDGSINAVGTVAVSLNAKPSL